MKRKIAYKVFNLDGNNNLVCCNKFYKVGEVAEISGELVMCENGIHFCWSLNDIHEFYNLKDSIICEVEILGDIINDISMKKSVTNKLKVIRMLTKEQVFSISNTDKDNTGYLNSGNRNSGHRNSGNANSGNRNSGDRNSGDWNSGDKNSGNGNSGDWNSGNANSGNRNSGDWNSGNRNSGHWNSGHLNSGNRNSGNANSGNRNSGHLNSCSYSNGIFCTQTPTIKIFNVDTDMTLEEFNNSKYYDAINSSDFPLTEWAEYTEEEKQNDKTKELIGGYLKTNTIEFAYKQWWKNMTQENRNIVKSIPNFNANIFMEITGIDVTKN